LLFAFLCLSLSLPFLLVISEGDLLLSLSLLSCLSSPKGICFSSGLSPTNHKRHLDRRPRFCRRSGEIPVFRLCHCSSCLSSPKGSASAFVSSSPKNCHPERSDSRIRELRSRRTCGDLSYAFPVCHPVGICFCLCLPQPSHKRRPKASSAAAMERSLYFAFAVALLACHPQRNPLLYSSLPLQRTVILSEVTRAFRELRSRRTCGCFVFCFSCLPSRRDLLLPLSFQTKHNVSRVVAGSLYFRSSHQPNPLKKKTALALKPKPFYNSTTTT
jgi:hypothetical protein